MDLQELRSRIDEVDNDLIRLVGQRMEISAEIAKYKQRHDLPVYDPVRERSKLDDLTGKVREDHKPYISALFTLLFELSRAEQEKVLDSEAH